MRQGPKSFGAPRAITYRSLKFKDLKIQPSAIMMPWPFRRRGPRCPKTLEVTTVQLDGPREGECWSKSGHRVSHTDEFTLSGA